MIGIASIVFTALLFQCLDCTTQSLSKHNQRLNYFDTDLLRYTVEELKGNVVISPASIKSVLAMLIEGASGATEVEIRNALRLYPNKVDYREQLNSFLSYLKVNDSNKSVENANAIFVRDDLKLKKEFELMIKNVYLADVFKISFKNNTGAAHFINSYINYKTRSLIPFIINPVQIEPSTNIIFINALYFKTTWKYSFDPDLSKGTCFYNNGVCRNVAMMELHSELNYAFVDNLRAHALELPYKGDRYSMIILVPLDRDGISTLIRDLPYMSLPQISELFDPTDVELLMPKFTVDYNQDMIEPLMNMKITTLFSTSSNLSGIFDGDAPQVNNIFHRVHISVDEQGTVAAAATSVNVVPLIGDGVQLRVDHPFLFFIRDNEVGITLFEGKIEEPTEFVPKIVSTPSPVKKHNSQRRNSYG